MKVPAWLIAGHRPGVDAACVSLLRSAGAVIRANCGPIKDPALRNACVGSFGAYEPMR